MSESDQQRMVVEWFRLQYPHETIISIPNGSMLGGRNRFAQAAKLKNEGVVSGVSDLFICKPMMGYAGLWLEMKDIGKTKCSLSATQKEWMSNMRAAGYGAEWAAGFESAKKIIEEYML